MLYKSAVTYLLCLFFSLSLNAQELRRVHPIKATASSYYKDPNLRVKRSYQEYAKYFRDNSPEKAFDGDKKSSWVTNDDVIGSWIELEFPYPINASKISVLGGCHVNDECYNTNKKIRKFQVINEHGESEKLVIKEPGEPSQFDLGFKKPSRTLRFKILNLSGETPRNRNYTIGFAEIFVGHMTYTSLDLKMALMEKDLDLLKKAIKSAKKKIKNPYAILTGGQHALEMATEDGSKDLAFELWKNGFRFHAGSTLTYQHITTRELLEDHFEQMDRANQEVNDLMTQLNDASFEANWGYLNKVMDSIKNEYELADYKQKNELFNLALQRRIVAAEKVLLQKIGEFSKATPNLKNLGLLFKLYDNEEELYQALNDANMPLVEVSRRGALNQMLEKMLSGDEAKIEALSDELKSIPALRVIKDDFAKTYSRYRKYESFQRFDELITLKKTQIITSSEQELKDYIDGQVETGRLDYVRSYYLAEVNDGDGIEKLRNYVDARKRKLDTENKIRAAKARLKEQRRVSAERALIYEKALANSKRTVTDSEWQQITREAKSDLDKYFNYYSVDDIDMDVEGLFTAYLSNLDHNSFYTHNSAINKSTKIVNSRINGTQVVFQKGQEIDSYWDSQLATIRLRGKPKVNKVVNSGWWKLAQRCESVKDYLETTGEVEVKVIGMRIHKETGLPLAWVTSLVKSTCVLRGAYDNCFLSCEKRINEGSDNFYFYVSDYVYRWNTK